MHRRGYETGAAVREAPVRPAVRAPNRAVIGLARAQRLAGNAAVANAMRGARAGNAPADVVAVQRLYGFEFQSSNSFVSTAAHPVKEKQQLAKAPEFTVEADQGRDATHFDIEFVTKPLDETASPVAAERAAVAAAAIAAAPSTSWGTKSFAKGAPIAGATWESDVTAEITDPAFRAKPQATVGVRLEHIGKLLELNVKNDPELATVDQGRDAMTRGRRPAAAPSPAAQGLLDMITFYVASAAWANPLAKPQDWINWPQEVFEDTGSTRHFPRGPEVLVADGPKASFRVMARTDFHQMYRSLDDASRLYVQQVVADSGFAFRAFRRRRAVPLFGGPYRADPDVVAAMSPAERAAARIEMLRAADGKTYPVVFSDLTVGQWLDSIVSGADPRTSEPRGGDLMSPPPGWGRRAPDKKQQLPEPAEIRDRFVYGMGAYPMVEGRGLFEVRNIAGKLIREVIPAAHWGVTTERMIKFFLKPAHDA